MVSKAVLRAHPRDTGSKINFDGGSELSDSHLDQISSKKKKPGKSEEDNPINHILCRITGIYVGGKLPPKLKPSSPLEFRNIWSFWRN